MFFKKNKILCQLCGQHHGEHEPCPIASPAVQFQQQVRDQILDTPVRPPVPQQESQPVSMPQRRQRPVDMLREKYQKEQDNTGNVCWLCRSEVPEVVYIIDRENRPALPLCLECRDFIIQQFINEDER